jgi:hypothetical protein
MPTNPSRFVKGCAPGPGRPKRQTEAAYLSDDDAACPLEAWSEIVASAVDAAKQGDSQAARSWLTKHLLGESTIAAPSPTQVIISELLDSDIPLMAAAKIRAQPELEACRNPLDALLYGQNREDEVLAKVAAELAEAEAKRGFLGA